MRLQKKSYSRVALVDLLRRRRSNLKKFISENGIVTHELLVSRCESMGVLPPSVPEFLDARGSITPEVSSPTEGVVVVLPPDDVVLTKEGASRPIEKTAQEVAATFEPSTIEPVKFAKKKKQPEADSSTNT